MHGVQVMGPVESILCALPLLDLEGSMAIQEIAEDICGSWRFTDLCPLEAGRPSGRAL